METPVVFISSNAWAVAAGVALHSLVEHYKGSEKLNIYIFSQDMSEENEARFRAYSTGNTEVSVIKVDASAWEKFAVKGHYVPPIVFLKCSLPRLLPQYERILCLDIDILVQKDISALMNTDLEGKYAVGVLDMTAMVDLGWHDRLNRVKYLNTGVLLLNAKSLRDVQLEEKIFAVREAHPEYQCMEQDAFNDVFHDEVKYVSPIWNLMSYNLWINPYSSHSIEQINDFYTLKYTDVTELEQDAAIVHLTNTFKPWEYEDAYMSDAWMAAFQQSRFSDIHLNLKRISPTAVHSEDGNIVHVIKRVGPFVKDWTKEVTTLQFFGIPLVQKTRGKRVTCIKVGPISVARRERAHGKERIFVFGFLVKETDCTEGLNGDEVIEQQLDLLDQMREGHDQL